jgi:hypothetical protein
MNTKPITHESISISRDLHLTTTTHSYLIDAMCVETAPGGGEHHAVASQLEQVRIIALPLLLLLSASE